MKKLITLILITNISYSIYRYPELYSLATEIAMEKAKSEWPSIKEKMSQCITIFANNAGIYTSKAVKGIMNIGNVKDDIIDDCNNFVTRVNQNISECKQAVADCKTQATDFGRKITSPDSLYAMVIPHKTDSVKKVKETFLPGDIYDIKYEIHYKGKCFYAHSRSLGKPRIKDGSIKYTLPTGQKYQLSLPDGEGRIKLCSTELIES